MFDVLLVNRTYIHSIRENILMVKNGVRIVVTAGHLRIMVTTEGV